MVYVDYVVVLGPFESGWYSIAILLIIVFRISVPKMWNYLTSSHSAVSNTLFM